jgi:hypothetical protein
LVTLKLRRSDPGFRKTTNLMQSEPVQHVPLLVVLVLTHAVSAFEERFAVNVTAPQEVHCASDCNDTSIASAQTKNLKYPE